VTDAGDIVDVVRGQSDWFKSLPKGATTRITPALAEDISAVLDIVVNGIERLREERDAARRRECKDAIQRGGRGCSVTDSDDIVARLRAVLNHDRAVELMSREAADEISRLRGMIAEYDRERVEYCGAWRKWIEDHESLDIMEWLNAYANTATISNPDREDAIPIHSAIDARSREAADEIERLRRRIFELEER
jgi:hypothetical protein